MVKRLNREQKKEKAMVDLVNQMFVIAGHNITYEDIKESKDWFTTYTMTIEQADEFKQWGKEYLRKELKATVKMAEREMEWFVLQYGLKYSNWESYNKEEK